MYKKDEYDTNNDDKKDEHNINNVDATATMDYSKRNICSGGKRR